MIKYIFTLLIFLLQCFTLFAGSFRPLSIKEGLSSRQVFQVSKDAAGFIWAYTHMGVDRYDGNEIKTLSAGRNGGVQRSYPVFHYHGL